MFDAKTRASSEPGDGSRLGDARLRVGSLRAGFPPQAGAIVGSGERRAESEKWSGDRDGERRVESGVEIESKDEKKEKGSSLPSKRAG